VTVCDCCVVSFLSSVYHPLASSTLLGLLLSFSVVDGTTTPTGGWVGGWRGTCHSNIETPQSRH